MRGVRGLALACAVAGVAAGCGGGPPPTADEAFCRARADDDPAVKAYIMKGTGNPHALLEDQERIRAARQDATTACLRSRGLVPPGGVERPKPR